MYEVIWIETDRTMRVARPSSLMTAFVLRSQLLADGYRPRVWLGNYLVR